jgi:hypothetical protein
MMTKPKEHPKDNNSYLHLDRPDEKTKAQEALEKAKALEAKKMAKGKKWVRIDHKTEVLR